MQRPLCTFPNHPRGVTSPFSLLSLILEPILPNSPLGISHPRTSHSVFSHHPLHPKPSPSHCMFLRQRLCGGSTPSLVLCTPQYSSLLPFSSTAPKLGKGNALAHPRITPYCVQPFPTFSRTRFVQGLCSPHSVHTSSSHQGTGSYLTDSFASLPSSSASFCSLASFFFGFSLSASLCKQRITLCMPPSSLWICPLPAPFPSSLSCRVLSG